VIAAVLALAVAASSPALSPRIAGGEGQGEGGNSAAGIPAVSFDEAVRRSIARAPAVLAAAAEVRRTEGDRGVVRSAALPAVLADAVATRMDGDRTLNGRIVTPRDTTRADLTAQIPLFAPQRWTAWSHASDAVETARLGELDVRRSAAIGAARAYLTVIAQKRALDVARTSADTARAHRDFSDARLRGGVGNRLDALRADQQLASAESLLATAEAAVVRAQEALGIATGEGTALDAASDPDLQQVPADEATTETRADVRAARKRLDDARAVSRDSWLDWLPQLLGSAQAYAQDPSTATSPANGWQAQLVLSLPLFEGGLRPAQKQQRDALVDLASVDLDALGRQARSEVRVGAQGATQAEVALVAARRGSESGAQALTLAQQAYAAGATSNIEVVDAEQRARDAAFAAVFAEDAVRNARLDLLAATGRFP
jgi:outer membrane protein TolC